MKKFLLSCAVMILGVTSMSAQMNSDNEKSANKEFYGIGNRIGIGVGVGTEGIGIDAAVSLTKYVSARVGVNIVPDISVSTDFDVIPNFDNVPSGVTIDPNHEGTVSADATLKRTTFDVKVDFYPFPNHSSFFICGGFSFGGKEVISVTGKVDDETMGYINQGADFGVDLDEYNIPIDKHGRLKATAEVKGVRPYLGIGFGRLIPKNRIGFRFEIGAQFQGKPEIKDYLGNNPLESIDSEASDDISDILGYMKVYPCIKLSLRGRIF